jgi:predicted TIM-barrel fold metal-dependent hydrolase
VIVDAHMHVFPAAFIAERDALLRSEAAFAEVYASPRARLATDGELSRVMDEDGIDHAVIAGFAWTDTARCRAHNDALLAAAAKSRGRLSAFCTVPPGPSDTAAAEMRRCAMAGARGFGELRLDALAGGPDGAALLHTVAETSRALGLPLLLHASEPVGHFYPGKGGGSLASIWSLLADHASLVAVLAHLGGGLPFYAHMPEVRALFRRVYADTAAVPWLYDAAVYRPLVDLIGPERLLFGSDYPLRRPARDLAILRGSGLTEAELTGILGGNAARLLGLAGVSP